MMFLGHYSVAYLIKKKYNDISLWMLFVAVQLVDILAFTLVLLGTERISYNPTQNPFLRTSMDYIPYTHSLSSSIIIALIVFFIFWRLKNKAWGTALFIAVASHWFIDFISHTPDMPLLFDRFKVGLGLWRLPWLAFFLEIAAFAGAGYYLYRGKKDTKRPVILIALAIILYSPVMFAPEGEAPVAVVCIMSLSLFVMFSALAYWSEK